MGMKPDELIAVQKHITENTDKGPATVMRTERVNFFKAHYNRCEGWFVWVQFPNGLWEIWFVVDTSGLLCDDNWHLEKIT